MAKILLIETASEVCSAAISDNGLVVALREEIPAVSHAAALTLLIQACTDQSGMALRQLDAVAVSSGPGAYTSLRVGASVAKGICFALDKPLIAVNTLQALAFGARRQYSGQPTALFIPALDARRQEIWTAIFDSALQRLTPDQPLVLENNSFENFIRNNVSTADSYVWRIAGNGTEKIRNGRIGENAFFEGPAQCSAVNMAQIAEEFYQSADFQDVAYFEPFYMKPPNITTPNPAKF